jgi:hypothetical protein
VLDRAALTRVNRTEPSAVARADRHGKFSQAKVTWAARFKGRTTARDKCIQVMMKLAAWLDGKSRERRRGFELME